MSKHNNNLKSSSSARCNCGRYMTLGEEQIYGHVINYECPDCFKRRISPITRKQYYQSFGIKYE